MLFFCNLNKEWVEKGYIHKAVATLEVGKVQFIIILGVSCLLCTYIVFYKR